jgi:hypothetical protein
MRLFALLMAGTGFLVYLLNYLSFWTLFGIAYSAGMVLVIMIACFGRNRNTARQSWNQSDEVDGVN